MSGEENDVHFPSTLEEMMKMFKDSEIYQGYQYFGQYEGSKFIEDTWIIGSTGRGIPMSIIDAGYDMKMRLKEKLQPKTVPKKVFKAVFSIYDENIETQADISEQEKDVYELIEMIITSDPNGTYNFKDQVGGYYNTYARFVDARRQKEEESQKKISNAYGKLRAYLKDLEEEEDIKIQYGGYDSDADEDDACYDIKIRDSDFQIPKEWIGAYRKGEIHLLFLEGSAFETWLKNHGYTKIEVEKEKYFPH